MDAIPEIRILIVDFLDSYTHNIPSFLQHASKRKVCFEVREYNKLAPTDVQQIIHEYDGVVLSPGPGTVENEYDLGDFTPALLEHNTELPIFGICLGFQAIFKHFGGSIHRLSEPHHGIIADLLDPQGKRLGRRATRYHSLEARLSPGLNSQLEVSAIARNLNDSSSTSVMEVKHKYRPIWGVQYHPESVASQDCAVVVRDFMNHATQRCKNRTILDIGLNTPPLTPPLKPTHASHLSKMQPSSVLWETIHTEVDLLEVARHDPLSMDDHVLLESAVKGRWSIFVSSTSAYRFQYSLRTGLRSFLPALQSACASTRHRSTLEEAWSFVQHVSQTRNYVDGPDEVPFWGGFVGYFSYELGLAQLGIDPSYTHTFSESSDTLQYDDIHLLWANESILYDKQNKTVYLLSLSGNTEWLAHTRLLLDDLAQLPERSDALVTYNADSQHPSERSYLYNIATAQDHIRAGNSYELCLTATTKVQPHRLDDRTPCTIFEHLRAQNPAEFMALLRLGGIDFISASPEEFLSFDVQSGTATMKPIKGTLPKTSPDGQPISFKQAETELHSTKVLAENLMIVDLVRNDLSKVSDHVTCSDPFHVDELETMYQLVSTVEARVRPGTTAWDLLRATLPPGSMTGAPKRRSCEILTQMEANSRALYSGVVGYIDVRGHCRTSVAIRNAARYPGETFWRVGAGGAITSMSDPQEEWLERQLKATSVLKAFQPRFEVLETILWTPQNHLLLWEEHMDRLLKSLQHFSFEVPGASGSRAANTSIRNAMSAYLERWLSDQMRCMDSAKCYRLSISINREGRPHLKYVQLPSSSSSEPVKVYLDYHTMDLATALEPFILHKTTNRGHYTSARERVGAEGRDEVLLFGRRIGVVGDLGTSILTEGSYTNVAVFDKVRQVMVTPRFGCLPGIERARLLRQGRIVEGEVTRKDLRSGMEVLLFNSVRGCFRGVIVSRDSARR